MAETVCIIDYNSGNLRSAAKALERVAPDATQIQVTADPDAVRRADRVVLPGVGAFGDCRAGIQAIDGLWDAIVESAGPAAKPFLGICVGMQLMAARGLEHGTHEGFGWIDTDVTALTPSDANLKIPHMGWNTLRVSAVGQQHPVLRDVDDGDHAYFVHSYAMTSPPESEVLASTDYGGPVCAIVGTGTCVGTQFHPEKSQRLGLALLAGFLAWRP